MTEREQLLRAILDNSAEDTPRLMYADWLQENSQPDRAEFIRAQVKIAQLIEGWKLENLLCLDMYLDPQDGEQQEWKHELHALWNRERRLYHSNACDWHLFLPGAQQFVCHATETVGTVFSDSMHVEQRFRRGFIESVTCATTDFLTHAEALFRTHPITAVKLVGFGWFHRGSTRRCRIRINNVEQLHHSPGLEPVTYLPVSFKPHVRGGPVLEYGDREYDTRDEYEAALCSAAVSWGRMRAGLRPLPDPVAA